MSKKTTALLASIMLALPLSLSAQEKIESDISAELTSNYVWRGQDLGNVSIQPSLSFTYKNISLDLWGSIGIDKDDDKEFDLTLGYSNKGFSISITDYWSATPEEPNKYFHYGARSTAHVFEAQIGYDFGPVAINWYTNFAGYDGVNEKGDRAYSSYLSLSCPFVWNGLEWIAEAGATPWSTSFYENADGFDVCEISLKASKKIKVADPFSLSFFTKATWNPATEGAYFTTGIYF